MNADVRKLAWELHRQQGHLEHKGKCWGPTYDEVRQAVQWLKVEKDDRAKQRRVRQLEEP